jgi:hypothetical protein
LRAQLGELGCDLACFVNRGEGFELHSPRTAQPSEEFVANVVMS